MIQGTACTGPYIRTLEHDMIVKENGRFECIIYTQEVVDIRSGRRFFKRRKAGPDYVLTCVHGVCGRTIQRLLATVLILWMSDAIRYFFKCKLVKHALRLFLFLHL